MFSIRHGPWINELKNRKINLSDSGHKLEGKIEILLGADVAGKLLTGTMFYLKSGPVAIKTKLGWTLMGKTYRNETKFDKNHFMNVTSMFVNDMCTSDLWKLDSLGITDPVETKTKLEIQKETLNHFQKTISVDISGRYEVALPWVLNNKLLSSNRKLAENRLESTKRKLIATGKFEEYQEKVEHGCFKIETHAVEDSLHAKAVNHLQEIIENDPVDKNAVETAFEMLHAKSVKLKKIDEDILELMIETNCTQEAYNIEFEAIEGYTEKMIAWQFQQFSGELTDWLRFHNQFKRIHEDESIDDGDKFQYLIQATTPKSRARDIVESFPATPENYRKAFEYLRMRFGQEDVLIQVYVRELLKLVLQNTEIKKVNLSSLYDKIEAQLRALESLGVTKEKYAAMLFPLVEFCLPAEILRAWERYVGYSSDESELESQPDNFETMVLGLIWNLKDDCLSCNINCQKNEGKAITKRSLLSIANHIFDPIGFTAPVTLKTKLILQEIWKLKLKWDENLPKDILNQVKKWLEQLPILASIKIPRCLNLSSNGIKRLTLHVFCDASKKAYAACVFLRV
ncbi:integrase catalytic domain-containing protein [Trichonephila clavipes]|nr:integrase catalytic domain-containing protein [Trichonephila clavipes]